MPIEIPPSCVLIITLGCFVHKYVGKKEMKSSLANDMLSKPRESGQLGDQPDDLIKSIFQL